MLATCPNILLLFTDQQRFDTIAALGNPVIKTPTLDRLAAEGTAFTRAYTPSPVCVSARCALITGLSPHVTGCTDNSPMDMNRPSLMQRLTAAGYQCHGTGKMHFVPRDRDLWGFESRDFSEECGGQDDFRAFLDAHGYEHVLDPQGVRSEYYYLPQPSQLPARLHHTTWVADRSIEFLQRRDRQRPFFLWSSFIKPHPPFEAPTPWNKLYRADEMPLPKRPERYDDLLTYWNRYQNRYKWRDQGSDDNLWRALKAAYYACISFIDFHAGRVLAELAQQGELDRTLVLFTSDHGELLGDYGSVGKRCMLDSAARVPLLARLPGTFAAGARCDEPASLLDILPTCLGAAGEQPACDAAGVDLAAVAAGTFGRAAVYSQFQSGAQAVYLRATRRYNYIRSAPDNREWLFDQQTDPAETYDLAANGSYRDALGACRAATIDWLEDETAAVAGGEWVPYPARTLDPRRDAHLLYQDPPASVQCPAPGYERGSAVGP